MTVDKKPFSALGVPLGAPTDAYVGRRGRQPTTIISGSLEMPVSLKNYEFYYQNYSKY